MKTALFIVLALFSSFAFSNALNIVQKPISFSAQRRALTLEYIKQHYDPNASSIAIQPVMVVTHWTATTSLQGTWNGFNNEILSGRADIARGGRVNTSAHYLIDRDGTIYQLMPENMMARHTIGLNRRAIGIENIGSRTAPLTKAQLEANAFLIADIAKRFPIQYVIGHLEYGRFRRSALWEEKDQTYFTVKDDPGTDFMVKLRLRLRLMGLKFLEKPS